MASCAELFEALPGCTVALITYCDTKTITACLPVITELLNTMIVAEKL